MKLLTVLGIVGGLTVMGLFSYACDITGEAKQVAREQFGPRAALRKYEWFKDTAYAIQALSANILNSKERLATYKKDNTGPIGTWPRDERESYRLTQTEVNGLIDKVNTMIGEYNSQADKFTWEMFNAEKDMPPLHFNTFSKE